MSKVKMTVTLSDAAGQEFNELAKRRGFVITNDKDEVISGDGKAMLVAWVRSEIAHERAAQRQDQAHLIAAAEVKSEIS